MMSPAQRPDVVRRARGSSARTATLLLICIFAGWTVVAAQQPDAGTGPEELFQHAVTLYDQGHYREAAEQFARLPVVYPRSPRVTAAHIMQAKALFWLGENMESVKAARALLTTSPTSAYAADAHYVLGSVYFRIGRRVESLQEFSRAWELMPRPEPPRLQESLGFMVDTIATRYLTVNELERVLAAGGPRDFRIRVLVNIAERHVRAEDTRAARATLDSMLSTFPELQSQPRVMRLLEQITERSDVKLGVLLPLMRNDPPSAAKEIAADVNDGIEYAVQLFMNDPKNRIKVTLVTDDTERDPDRASNAVRSMASDQRIVGIIGPMFSSTTLLAARAAQEESIPLITPTANANGIAATGSYVFQTNPDYDMRGRAMARWAVTKKGFKHLGVLAPSDAYGKFLAEGFVDEARLLGATIVAAEWYERGKTDLSVQLRNIRRAGLRVGSEGFIAFGGKKKLGELMKLVALGVPVKTLDSLLHKGAMVNAVKLLGPDAAARLDSLGIAVVYNEILADSLDYPIKTIEALYAPIGSPQEIGVVSAQTVYFNIQAQILGSGEWNSLPELDEHRRYSTGVMFESESYTDTLAAAYRDWAAGYRERYHRRPTKNSLFGYDAAAMVLGAMRDGATTRHALARALSGTRNYVGLHSVIGLTSGRVNNALFILLFDGHNIIRLDEVRVE
jgi:ABC-type branched-subunit amino acid transport system substrate-binding protein